jgi:hypothetical protein
MRIAASGISVVRLARLTPIAHSAERDIADRRGGLHAGARAQRERNVQRTHQPFDIGFGLGHIS